MELNRESKTCLVFTIILIISTVVVVSLLGLEFMVIPMILVIIIFIIFISFITGPDFVYFEDKSTNQDEIEGRQKQ